MAICCFPNCAYLSETSRMIAVYKKLRVRKEKVIMATHGGTYEFVLDEEGIPYHRVKPAMTHERSLQYVAANRNDAGFGKQMKFYNTEELREHVQGEIAFFKEHNISVVLTGWTLSAALSARAAGIPLATSHMGSYVPPAFGKMGIPGPALLNKFMFRLISESGLSNFYNCLFNLFLPARQYNLIAKELKIEPFRSLMDVMMGDLALVTDVPEILGIPKEELENWTRSPRFYSRNLRLKYVGAVYAELFGDLPEDVKEYLDTDKPKVYVALTSSRADWISSIYKQLKGIDARVVFVTTVHNQSFKQCADIMIKKHLPSHKVMPLVDCAVIYGGQGSVQTAIASGTPLVGYPLQGEQYFNLKMIENHGAGICLPLNAIRKRKIRPAIDKILHDGSYKAKMQRLKTYQNSCNGADNIAQELQRFIKK